VDFFEEVKILIDKAVQNPSTNHHRIWIYLMDTYVSECEKVAAPIMQVLNSIAAESVRLKNKYRFCIGSSVTCSIIGTVLAGVLVVHYLPVCGFTLTAGGLMLSVIGLIASIGIGISFVIGAMNCSQIRAVYDRCVTELKTLIMKYMSCLLGKSLDTVTKEQLNSAIKVSLNTFKMEEAMWNDKEMLEVLQRQTDRILKRLKEQS